MALTKDDLRQINILIQDNNKYLLGMMMENFVTRAEFNQEINEIKEDIRLMKIDINQLKDDFASMSRKLDMIIEVYIPQTFQLANDMAIVKQHLNLA